MADHSIWSPSAFDRWSACPASALATKDCPRVDTDASRRGTWMHAVAQSVFDASPELENEIAEGLEEFGSDQNMVDVKKATDYVQALIDSCSILEEPEVNFEVRVALPSPNEDVFGTVDVLLYDRSARTLYVIDYKFGFRGVDATDNGQLRTYASAAVQTLFNGEVDTVIVLILQPSAPQWLKVDSLSVVELRIWTGSVLYPALMAAHQTDAPFIPSEDACRYCPLAKSEDGCPAQTSQVMDIFDQVADTSLVNADFGDLLPKIRLMEQFISSVWTRAQAHMLDGGSIDGYKLVKGVTKRKWADPTAAEKWLAARKIPKDQRTETRVIGIPAAEKLLADYLKTNARMQKAFEGLIVRPEGKLTLARDDDRRTAVSTYNPIMEDMI